MPYIEWEAATPVAWLKRSQLRVLARTPSSKSMMTLVRQSAATVSSDTDLIRPPSSSDLHQRPSLTTLRLVRIEGIASDGHGGHQRHCRIEPLYR